MAKFVSGLVCMPNWRMSREVCCQYFFGRFVIFFALWRDWFRTEWVGYCFFLNVFEVNKGMIFFI